MPETQLMIWAWSLAHACVATVASLAEEMIGMHMHVMPRYLW